MIAEMWKRIENDLSECPKSRWAIIHNEDETKMYDTKEDVYRGEYPANKDDSEILLSIINHIKGASDRHQGREMYVRVYPEIKLSEDGTLKRAYCRLQFADKTKMVRVE